MHQLGLSSLLKPSRRSFLAGAGVTSAVLLSGCSDNGLLSPVSPGPTTPQYSDVDILNFALNTEYLEAEFFLRTCTGSGLQAADAGPNPGTISGSSSLNGALTGVYQQYCAEIAQQELNHLRAIQAAIVSLGGTYVSRPNLDFGAFAVLAQTAGIGGTFNAFADVPSFLLAAFIFGDVGVAAYTGAAPLISSPTILNAAAGVQAMEAYHAAEIRTLIVGTNDSTIIGEANMIQTLRASLGGGAGTETILTSGVSGSAVSASSIAQASPTTGIGLARNFDETLHIVYGTGGGAGVTGGGFFPSGFNGTISTTKS